MFLHNIKLTFGHRCCHSPLPWPRLKSSWYLSPLTRAFHLFLKSFLTNCAPWVFLAALMTLQHQLVNVTAAMTSLELPWALLLTSRALRTILSLLETGIPQDRFDQTKKRSLQQSR